MNIRRTVISNRQRLWWLRNFPDLIHPVTCLMPLYGQGLRRPAAFRASFAAATLLGLHKNVQGEPGRLQLISTSDVRRSFPNCRTSGLDRGAIWQDAFMPRPHRVVAELLHWAESAGAIVKNRLEFMAAERDRTGPWQLSIRDNRTGETLRIAAHRIVNASGSATDEVAGRILGRPARPILIPTSAWGVLLERPPMAEYSVAVSSPAESGRTWFVHPYHGRVLAGTGHAGVAEGASLPTFVTEAQIAAMLADLNEAMPGAGLDRDQVIHVFHGILPGLKAGSEALLQQARIIDHAARDGVADAWTVLGVKFTEAPSVAVQFWNSLPGTRSRTLPLRPAPLGVPTIEEARGMSDSALEAELRRIAKAEWQASADDLIFRRTDLWMDTTQALRVTNLDGGGRLKV